MPSGRWPRSCWLRRTSAWRGPGWLRSSRCGTRVCGAKGCCECCARAALCVCVRVCVIRLLCFTRSRVVSRACAAGCPWGEAWGRRTVGRLRTAAVMVVVVCRHATNLPPAQAPSAAAAAPPPCIPSRAAACRPCCMTQGTPLCPTDISIDSDFLPIVKEVSGPPGVVSLPWPAPQHTPTCLRCLAGLGGGRSATCVQTAPPCGV
jgi:hypothetical protein